MTFKNLQATVLTFALASGILIGCGGEVEQEENVAENSSEIKIGMLMNLNASENEVDELYRKIDKKSGVKLFNHKTIYYENLPALEMGIASNKIQEITTYKCVADYLIGKTNKFEVSHKHQLRLQDNFCFAFLKDKANLKTEFNKALGELKADGTLEKLTKKYVADLNPNQEPAAVNFQRFDGAETIKVAVTGDLPPLDLILPNGDAAGFSTALLAEIGKRLQKNFELVDIDSGAREIALTSGKVDAVFWAIQPSDEERPADIDMPADVELSVHYFADEIIHINLKK